MSAPAKPIPDGYHSLQPYFIVRDATKALAFYKDLFGAVEMVRMTIPGTDKIMHAELRIGDSVLMLTEESPEWNAHSPQKYGGSPVSVMVYVANVDALFAKATAAGCQAVMPPADMFWGDRFCKFVDPFGHVWAAATHIADPTPEEIAEGAKKFFAA
ncbi:MAG TPA: VOC family protein [Verrucomicrobiota bacterium]|nr:glyoxalase [Verrucomicrobiales bacterium]HRI12588.1 VOC family protein [Verrucomicrobiota bacterium]